VSRWPVAGPSGYGLLASRSATKVKQQYTNTTNTQKMTTKHTRKQQLTKMHIRKAIPSEESSTQLQFVLLYEIVTTDVYVYFLLQITHPAVLTYKVRNKQLKFEHKFIKYSKRYMFRPYGRIIIQLTFTTLKKTSYDVNRAYTD
jgi:hypothetical protein